MVHLFCLAYLCSFCKRYKEAHQISTFCFLLGDNFKTKSFLQEAQCSLNMITCALYTKLQVRGTRPRFVWSASQWRKSLLLRFTETVLSRVNHPQPWEIIPRLRKWSAHRTNPPLTERKSHLNNTQTHRPSCSGWFTVSRCRYWWANAEAGTRGDAGWSLSPERRH